MSISDTKRKRDILYTIYSNESNNINNNNIQWNYNNNDLFLIIIGSGSSSFNKFLSNIANKILVSVDW